MQEGRGSVVHLGWGLFALAQRQGTIFSCAPPSKNSFKGCKRRVDWKIGSNCSTPKCIAEFTAADRFQFLDSGVDARRVKKLSNTMPGEFSVGLPRQADRISLRHRASEEVALYDLRLKRGKDGHLIFRFHTFENATKAKFSAKANNPGNDFARRSAVRHLPDEALVDLHLVKRQLVNTCPQFPEIRPLVAPAPDG